MSHDTDSQNPVRRCFEVEVFIKGEDGHPITRDFGVGPAILIKQEICFELTPEHYERATFLASLDEFSRELLRSTVDYRIKEVVESDAS